MFETSIRKNLLIANPDADEEMLIDACKQAQIWDFVEKQTKGLDTWCGADGTQLSGG